MENKLVSTVPQVAKYMKSVSGSNVTLRVERVVENYVAKWKLNEAHKELAVSLASEVKCTLFFILSDHLLKTHQLYR